MKQPQLMNKEMAEKIIEEALYVNQYIFFEKWAKYTTTPHIVKLEGEFTAEQLKAIIFELEN